MATYIVTVPFRGVQTYLVEAGSAAEAKRLARYGETDGVEPLDFRVTRTYEPSQAELEAATTPDAGAREEL